MRQEIVWQNKSVVEFAKDADPVERMEEVAQTAVLEAVDLGWQGPPFDPLELATLRGISVRPNASVRDARIFDDNGHYIIEYNPNKSLGRVNFSIAHEIAHTFFSDWAKKVRHRARTVADDKNWQLEMLCNIGAAEILMPVGSISGKFEQPQPIEDVMTLRKEFQVSTEAILIRMAKTAKFPVVSFVASRIKTQYGNEYRIDYAIPSSTWRFGKLNHLKLKKSKCFDECVAIGTTAKSTEKWLARAPEFQVEAVGLPPYPGSDNIRIAGFAYPKERNDAVSSFIEYRHGDATRFFTDKKAAIVHIVNNKARTWGGFGFARLLRQRYPEASEHYRDWATNQKSEFKLGALHFCRLGKEQFIVSIVAQSGFGQSMKPRIRYSALHTGLESVSEELSKAGIFDIQMPRIGAGQAGGNWNVIQGIIHETLVLRGVSVRVYDLPPS